MPSPDAARAPAALDEEARQRLASLGYVSAGAAPVVRPGRAAAGRHDGAVRVDRAPPRGCSSSRTIRGGDSAAREDPRRRSVQPRRDAASGDRAVSLGRDAAALQVFRKAAELAPQSIDVSCTWRLHYARGREWERAGPLLEEVIAKEPDRVAALEALATVRERQARVAEAISSQAADLRAACCVAVRAGAARPAGDERRADRRRDRRVRGRARRQSERVHATTSNSGSSTLRRAVSRRPRRRWIAFLRVQPEYPMALFKRAQVACCCTNPIRPRASTPPAAGPTRRRAR